MPKSQGGHKIFQKRFLKRGFPPQYKIKISVFKQN